MSLPILHSAAGYAFYKAGRKNNLRPDFVAAALCVFLANAPDLDFIPGILFNEASRFHRGVSHSFLAAALTGAAVSALLWLRRKKDFFTNAFLFFAAYSSHLILDVWGSASKGVYIFWPIIDRPFYGPFMQEPVAPAHPLDTALGFHEFISALLTRECLETLFFELAVVFIFWSLMTAAGFTEKKREHIPLSFIRCAAALVFWSAAIVTAHY